MATKGKMHWKKAKSTTETRERFARLLLSQGKNVSEVLRQIQAKYGIGVTSQRLYDLAHEVKAAEVLLQAKAKAPKLPPATLASKLHSDLDTGGATLLKVYEDAGRVLAHDVFERGTVDQLMISVIRVEENGKERYETKVEVVPRSVLLSSTKRW